METAVERFLRYVKVYTDADENSGLSPSSERQKDLGRLLMEELNKLGLKNITMDTCGNVLADLPANIPGSYPRLALISHMDTCPDASGKNVKPRIVRYDGGELALNETISLNEKLCPGIGSQIGEEIIVTDGTTLLGADDKAGIAEIMAAVEKIIVGNIPHGDLKIIFTTDEEIGNGVDGLDVKELACDFGYTVDGGAIGEIEYENFNAAEGRAKFKGVGVHPGSAKDIMINAATTAMEFHTLLPEEQVPEKTEGYEGFFHLHGMSGNVTDAELIYIIRDHDMAKFEEKKELFLRCGDEINRRHGDGVCTVSVTDSYYNMKEMILPHIHLIRRAQDAFNKNGVEPVCVPIRGGTDGARLSWDGLPCPNLSTGGCNFHGVREWIPVKSLEIMADVIVDLAVSFTEK